MEAEAEAEAEVEPEAEATAAEVAGATRASPASMSIDPDIEFDCENEGGNSILFFYVFPQDTLPLLCSRCFSLLFRVSL